MTKQLKNKRSIGNKLLDHYNNAMHSLKQISNAVLLHNDQDREIDGLFDSFNSSEDLDVVNRNDSLISKSSNKDKDKNINRKDKNLDRKDKTLNKSFNSGAEVNSPSSKSLRTTSTISTSTQVTSTQESSNATEIWEQQRSNWLQPTIPKSDYEARKKSHSLGKLAEYNDDVYLGVYKNLVVYGKSLKHGLNMQDGFKVIYSGWENTKMFERVARGGAP